MNFLSWVKKGGFAVLDQGLFAGAHFVTNILLARWLTKTQYGAFSLVYSIFLLLGTFHTALFTEPMVVFGSGRFSDKFKHYLALVIKGNLIILIPVGIIIAITSLFVINFYSIPVGRAFLGLAVAGPLILFLWLLRRAFYIDLKPQFAALGGSGYLMLLLIGIFILKSFDLLSQTTAFLAMGVSAFCISLFFILGLKPRLRDADPTLTIVAREHWRYGRWALGTSGLIWIPSNVYFVILPVWIGLEGVATLRALMNLIMPILHAIGAISLLLLPLLSRRFKEGIDRLTDTMRTFFIIYLSFSVFYFFFLVVFKNDILYLLYGGNYSEFSNIVPIVGLLPLGASLTYVLGSALRAIERPDKVFLCYIISTIFTLSVGLFLVVNFRIIGAFWALLLSSLITGSIMFLFYNNLSKALKR